MGKISDLQMRIPELTVIKLLAFVDILLASGYEIINSARICLNLIYQSNHTMTIPPLQILLDRLSDQEIKHIAYSNFIIVILLCNLLNLE